MADQDQYGNAQSQDLTPERRQYQQLPQRSAASTNWRMKDSSPRAEPQPRMRQQRQGLGSPQQFNEQAREVSDTRLYVGNLLYSATKMDIMQFFADNGFNPTNLTMSVDPETGRNPSYCFADFETSDEASRAISELNGQDLLGRTVRISPGVARKPAGEEGSGRQYSSPRSWGQQQQDGSRQAFGGYNRSDGYSSYNRNRDQEGSGPAKKLYVGGLPDLGDQTEVEKSMKSLFDQFGIQLTYVSRMIAPHESKASEPGDHFYCFVELARPEDVEVAIESLDQKPSPYAAEGTLRVNKAKEQTRRTGGGAFGNQGGGFKDRRADGTRDWRTPREPTAQ